MNRFRYLKIYIRRIVRSTKQHCFVTKAAIVVNYCLTNFTTLIKINPVSLYMFRWLVPRTAPQIVRSAANWRFSSKFA